MWACRWPWSSASTSIPWASTSRRIASPSSRTGKDSTLECSPAELKAAKQAQVLDQPQGSGALPRLHRHGADADRSLQPSRPDAARAFQRDRRQGLKKGDVVVYESTVYPGCTEEVCIPILERESGSQVQQGFLRGLQPRAHQSGRQGTPAAEHQEGDLGLDARSRRLRRQAVSLGGARRHAQGVEHPRGRGRQGHREHAARRQHRADQRAGAAVQPARHRHRRSAAGRRQQVELPAVPPGPGRRPLHRRRSLLPDAQGAGDRLPSRDDPRRPPAQRQHG